jgi:23S rRNA (adenine2503-C2)-methyltransferase
MADGVELSPARLAEVFDPEVCLVKLTPLNPTAQSRLNGLSTVFDAGHRDRVDDLVADIRSRGFDCVVSTGLAEEVELSTSCGQLARIRRAAVRGNGAVDDKWDRGEARQTL